MEVTFYIHKGTKNYVYASCYADDGRVRKSVCAYPYDIATFPDNAPKPIKNLIHAISLRTDKHISTCNIGRLPVTKKDIEDIIDLEAGRKPKQEKQPMVSELISIYMHDVESGNVKGTKLSAHKLLSVKSAYNLFIASGLDCRIDVFDFEDWTSYLVNYRKKNKQPISRSTICHRQLIIKQAIAYTYGKKHSVKITTPLAGMDDIDNPCYYTIPEILHLNTFPFTGTKELARDIFVYGCFLGFRRADFLRHDSSHIENGKVSIITGKRKTAASVPLSSISDDILKRYRGEPPKMASNLFHRNIKRVCKEAGFTEPLTIVRTIGGKKTEITKKKYELTSWHTMRRSCATNMLNGCRELGIPPIEAEAVRKMMGWKTDKMVQKYNKATAEEVAASKAAHPLFNIQL